MARSFGKATSKIEKARIQAKKEIDKLHIEIRIADTWTDHMQQHERVTKNVQIMEDKIRLLLKNRPKPIVSHFIGKSASK